MRVVKSNINYFLLCFVIVFVPLHYFVCEILLSGSKIDNLFRDLVIISLFLSVTKLRFKKKDILMLLSAAILISSALISYFVFHYPGTLNVLKTYLMPILFYFVCSTFHFTKKKYIKLLRILIVEMAIIGIVGFFQAFFLGDQFLLGLGYPSKNGFLEASSYYIGGYFGYQRNIATLVSPNACGAVLAGVLLVHLLDKFRYVQSKRWLITYFLIIALLGTFSRSAILGAIIAFAFVKIVLLKANLRIRYKKNWIWVVPIAIVLLVVVLFIDSKFLNGIFSRMLQSSFSGTVKGTDTSMIAHIQDLFVPLTTVLNNPFGLGFGSNGPMAIATMSNANAVESSVYLMMFEVGIIPAIIVFLPYVKLIVDTIRNKKYDNYVPTAVTIMTLVTYIAKYIHINPSHQSFMLSK